jgi:predicted AlkP superfamily pyrophosphatase or phosphodiesterase
MKISSVFRVAVTVLVAFLVGSCATGLTTGSGSKPRLVVFLVVDGLPQRQVVDYRAQLVPDGLARFLDRGAWFSEAYYGYAFTVTCAGHASMLTGTYAYRHGIIGNEFFNRETGEPDYCAADTSATYIGHKTAKLDGTSPKYLRAESVGDVLKRADARSKVIAISGKDRGAIMPAGKTGTAYMYMSQSGQFASSTFYMKEHPAWVNDFNNAKPADKYFKAQWKPLLDEAAYARSIPDEQKWFAKGGKLPMTMGEGEGAPGASFYASLLRSPFADALSLEFARAAIRGESLGQDDAPDILIVSLSGHDYVNHAFSAESRLSHDHLLQLDRLFQSFFHDLDEMVGKGNYVAVLTADHGFMPAPETSLAAGRDAGRVNAGQVLTRLNAGLVKRFGEGKWAMEWSASAVILNQPLIDQRKVDRAALYEEARKLLLAEPGVGVVYTRAELESGSRAGAPFFEPMRKSWHREVSGDLQVSLKPYWMFASSTAVTTHGSPHDYDTHVPILFYGPAWVKPGRIDTRVEVSGIAPTLARMLGIAAPPASEGTLLPLASP